MAQTIQNKVGNIRAVSIFLEGKTLPAGEVYKPTVTLLLPKDKLSEGQYGIIVSDLRTAFADGDKKIESMTPEDFMKFLCAKSGAKSGIKDLESEAMTDETYAPVANCYAVKFNAGGAFPIVSPDNQIITAADLSRDPYNKLFKSGCKVHIKYGVRCYNHNGSKGLSRYLNAVMAAEWNTPENQILTLGAGALSTEAVQAEFAEYAVELPTSDEINF
jgi:hypothetical protein